MLLNIPLFAFFLFEFKPHDHDEAFIINFFLVDTTGAKCFPH